MIKKHFFLIIALFILLTLALTSCHGQKQLREFEIPESFDTTKNYEITFWAKNDTNKTQTRIYEKAIADFEEYYPNIKVNLKLYTDYKQIYNDVITNISTRTTPNVCITYPDHIATYLTGNNVVVPLDELINNEKYGLGGNETRFLSIQKEQIIPQFLEDCLIGDACYALPFMRSTEACYINKTYVEALGFTLPETLTWDFIWEVSDAATKKAEDDTYILNSQKVLIPFIYKSTDNMMIQMLAQKGAGYSTDAGDILLFNDTTKELLNTIADHVRIGAFSTFKISSYPANFLNAGQCIFAVDSTAGSTWMGSHAPLSDISADKYVEFETAVMTVPQFDPSSPKMISQGPSVCIFNKDDPQEVVASWLFTQFLLSDNVQIAYAETEGYVPVTTSAQNSAEYVDYLTRAGEDNDLHYDVKIKATKLLLENVSNTFVTPVFNGSASLRDASGQLIENVAKSIMRHETVDDAYFPELYKNITSLYRLDQINSTGTKRAELGALPPTAVFLIAALGVVWVFIGLYAGVNYFKKRKEKKS